MSYLDHIDKQAKAVIALDREAMKVKGASGYNIKVSNLSGGLLAEYQLPDEFFQGLVELIKDSYAHNLYLHDIAMKEVHKSLELAKSKCNKFIKG